jgi:hypothetical protein
VVPLRANVPVLTSVSGKKYWEMCIIFLHTQVKKKFAFFFINPAAGGRAEHLRRQPRIFGYILLAAHRRKHFQVILTIF